MPSSHRTQFNSCGMLISFQANILTHALMAKKSGIKIIKITLLVIGCLLLIALLCIPFVLPGIVKSELTAYVEEHTENHLEIGSIAFTGFHSIELSGIDLKPKLGTKDF